MAEQVGSIVYSASIDTSGVMKGEQALNKATSNVEKNFRGLETQVNKSTRAISSATRQNIQNASFQIQDFAVQVASGQSGMVAFVQQFTQLVAGFGLFGAGIATATAVLGGLYLAFGDAQTNAEKLEKAIEGVQAVITLGVDGVTNYTEEMQKLANLSETLAQLRLSLAIADQSKAIELGLQGIREALDDTRGSFTTYTGQVEKLLKVSRGTDGFAAAERAFRDYSSAVSTFSKSGDVENLEQSLLALSEAGASNTEVGQNLIRTTVDLIAKFRQGQITIEALKSGLEDTAEVTDNSREPFDRLTKSLNSQLIEMQQGARAAFQYKLANSELTPEQQAAALATYDRVEAQRQLNKETQDFLTANERALEQEQRKKEMQRNTLERQVQGIGLTPLQEIEQRYAQELELLRQAEEQGIQIRGTYAERQKQIEAEKTDAIKRLNEGGMSFLSNVFSNFEQQSAAALTSVVTGAQSGSDALKGLARTILTSVIQAIIQQGIASATAAATAATAQSAANATIAATAAPAAAAVSLATAGANAPLATAGISSTVGVAAALFGATALAGARQFGGPVTSGKSYLVGERGPEIFTPNGSGSITSNKDSFGGGINNFNVYNYASNDLSFEPSINGDTVDLIVRKAEQKIAGSINAGQGPVPNAMRQSGTFRTDARRGR